MIDTFVRTYENRSYRFPTLVNHGGTVVAFAMDDRRRIRYAVLGQAPDGRPDVAGWPAEPRPLPLTTELVPVGFTAVDPTELPRVPIGTTAATPEGGSPVAADLDPFLSSTARLTAAAPFQVVSDGLHLSVFRQSLIAPTPGRLDAARATLASPTADPEARADAQDVLTDLANMVFVTDEDGSPVPLVDGRILVDRFVVTDAELEPAREVRFQRSRNKSRPAGRTDGLGATDLENRAFVEPTQELRFLPPTDRGRFAVALAPTGVAEAYRWQIVCADEAGGALWSYSVERSGEGLFDTAGRRTWTCPAHGDVFALVPGTCTRKLTDGDRPCGRALVEMPESTGGSAGCALELTAAGRVSVHGATVLGDTFTLEAWVRPAAGGTGEQILVGGGEDDASSSPTLRIVGGTDLRVGFGDGSSLRAVTASGVVRAGEWQHLAAVYDGLLLSVVVDGVLRALSSEDLSAARPAPQAPQWIGGGFVGTVDEVRMWSRPLDVLREIPSRMHVRRSGLEEGLSGYWRFDEGVGTTVWDQAGPATGTVSGASWVTSDAPVGSARGVTRTALRTAGWVPAGGVSTTVYYQQENAIGGYDGAPRPHKGAARVMVAAVLAPAAADGRPDSTRIGVLDFGLGRDGRLADLPTEVDLPVLPGPGGSGGALGAVLDDIGDQESRIAVLESDVAATVDLVADLTSGLEKAGRATQGLLGVGETITGACADLAVAAAGVDMFVRTRNMMGTLGELQPLLDQWLGRLVPGMEAHRTELGSAEAALPALRHDLDTARAQLSALQAQSVDDVVPPMPVLHVDSDGSTVSGAVLDFADGHAAPALFDSALGSLGLYFGGGRDQLSVARYDVFTGRTRFAVPAGARQVTFVPYSAATEYAGLLITVAGDAPDVCDLTVTLPLSGDEITETWRALPRTPAAFAAILAGSASRTEYDYGQNARTTAAGVDLAAGSRLVAVDARFATVQVASGTAVAVTAPPSARWFGDPPGTTLHFEDATIVGTLDCTALRLDGVSHGVRLGDPDRLAITGPITLEAWIRPTAKDGLRNVVAHGYQDVPARAEVYLRISEGMYEVGSWDGTDHYAAAPVPETDLGTWVHLAGVYDGTRWLLYRNGVLANAADSSVGAVAVATEWTVGVGAQNDRRFAGDVDDVRVWNRARTAAEIAGAFGTRLAGTEAGLAGYWFAAAGGFPDRTTGHTDGTLQGTPAAVASPPALVRAVDFGVVGDVSVEAWVNPEVGDRTVRLAQHRSDDGDYVLGLRTVPSALAFNGRDQMVRVVRVPELDVQGTISVEAWVYSTVDDGGVHYIAAHGLDGSRLNEVTLRVIGNRYQFGGFVQGREHFAVGPDTVDAAADRNRWVHLCGVYDGAVWRLYRDGELIASLVDDVGAPSVDASWAVGASADGTGWFAGSIGEVRVWRAARTPEQVAEDARAPRWLDGSEPDLALCVRNNGGTVEDVSPARHRLEMVGGPVPTDGPGGAFHVVAGTGPQYAESTRAFPGLDWTHVAMTFRQDYAVHLHQNAYLDAGTKDTLSITGDLTLEVAVSLDDLSAPHGLLTRGGPSGTGELRFPYALGVDTDGAVRFEFVDTDGLVHSRVSAPHVVGVGVPHRVGLVRKLSAHADHDEPTVVDRRTDVSFVVDGAPVATAFVDGEAAVFGWYVGWDAVASDGPLRLGRRYGADGSVVSLRGSLTEVRLWRKALDPATVGGTITGTETGLVCWWQLAEGTGSVSVDARGTAPAAFRGAVTWVRTPDPTGSALCLYVDGVAVAGIPVPAPELAPTADGFFLGRDGAAAVENVFSGRLEELRVWRTCRTTAQIQDDLFRRIGGGSQDLVACYTFDGEPGGRLGDRGPRGNTLQVVGGAFVPSDAPVGPDAPQVRNAIAGITGRYTARLAGDAPSVTEYAALETAADGTPSGVYKRCYGYIDGEGRWRLVTGYKVGDLTVEWVGQAQFDPQVVGFIEGPPPVPSENLTVFTHGYDGASKVTITQAETTKYRYSSSRNAGVDASAEMTATTAAETLSMDGMALGAIEIEAPLGVGVGEAELVVSLFEVEKSKVGGSVSITAETSTSWLSANESGEGAALTQASGMALSCWQEPTATYPDLGQRWLPENQGMALVKSKTADVFALRLKTTGALVAYRMRPDPDIPEDWNVLTFTMDPRYTKAGVLDGKVGLHTDEDYPNGLTPGSDASYFKPGEAYQLKARIDREQQELASFYAQFDAGPLSGSGVVGRTAPATRRNLANSYVWTAAGGFFAETHDVMDSLSESTGGRFELSGSIGGSLNADVDVFGVEADLDVSASIGAHLELEVEKVADTDRDFGVEVEVDTERDISTVVTVLKEGQAVEERRAQDGKVDAYRFMTFYLRPDTDHHDVLFNQVIDPVWLDGDEPAAAAMREARQPGRSPACWRVLHRVTFVSRILPTVQAGGPGQDAYAEAMRAADLNSNYELITTLDPYLTRHTADRADFAGAVRTAVHRRLPELEPHLDQIVEFLAEYYQVPA